MTNPTNYSSSNPSATNYKGNRISDFLLLQTGYLFLLENDSETSKLQFNLVKRFHANYSSAVSPEETNYTESSLSPTNYSSVVSSSPTNYS